MIGDIPLKGILHNGLYKFDIELSNATKAQQAKLLTQTAPMNTITSPSRFVVSVCSLSLWHQRLDHTSIKIVRLTLMNFHIQFHKNKSNFNVS